MKKPPFVVVLAGVAGLGAQLIQPSVPEIQREAGHDLMADRSLDPRVRSVLKRACADCHSNDSHFPWYARVSPVSWLIASHVKQGRQKLNFSDWPRNSANERQDIADAVDKGEMPLGGYLLIHPDARLSSEDRKVLEDWADSGRAQE